MKDYLRVGVIANTHGIRGEVKVFPTTDDVKRFEQCKELIMIHKKVEKVLHIENVKYFKNLAIIKFEEYNKIEEVQVLHNAELYVTRENAVALEEGEYFICDIIGATVETKDGEQVGELIDVLQTGANDVYIVKTQEGEEILFPVIPECILERDIPNKKVVVEIMNGLM